MQKFEISNERYNYYHKYWAVFRCVMSNWNDKNVEFVKKANLKLPSCGQLQHCYFLFLPFIDLFLRFLHQTLTSFA